MINFFLSRFSSYLIFLRYYLKATFLGLIVDLVLYTFLRNYVNIITSASISFIASQITLFTILNSLQVRKIRKKRYALPLQFLIGIVTISIHVVVLKFIDSNNYLIKYLNIQNIFLDKNLYNFITKFIAACVGFIWNSLMTRKFIFTPKR